MNIPKIREKFAWLDLLGTSSLHACIPEQEKERRASRKHKASIHQLQKAKGVFGWAVAVGKSCYGLWAVWKLLWAVGSEL